MLKKFLPLLLFLLFSSLVKAYAEDKFVTVINPVRGDEFWEETIQSPLDFPNFQKKIFEREDIKATWLLRTDFLADGNLSVFFKDERFRTDELGVFLEITPKFAESAGVKYNAGETWSAAKSVFLSGYNREERKKLVDFSLGKFKDIFGYYPKTVGAWHIDPYSAVYLRENYDIEALVICSDQYSTDGYQIWGGWWGVPYYPSKKNLLVPAASKKTKIDTIILWWAVRDPVNGYGKGAESTFSVQVNDYLSRSLDSSYFEKLADFYLNPKEGDFGHLLVGLENDYQLEKYGGEFQKQIEVLKGKEVDFVTAAEFSKWYKNRFPKVSPKHIIEGSDPLGGMHRALWVMDIEKRAGFIQQGEKWFLRDLRFYQPVSPDSFLWQRNTGEKLFWNLPAIIDTAGGETTKELAPSEIDKLIKLEEKSFTKNSWLWVLPLAAFLIVISVFSRIKPKILLLIFAGSLLVSATMLRSGRFYDFGLGFWGPNGHDAIWHLSLIDNFFKRFPPLNPIFSGENLRNYHWGFDMLAAVTTKILSLPVLDVYFRFLPIIFAFLIGVLSFILGVLVSGNNLTGLLFVFLNYFAGSFGFIVTLLRNGKLGGESLFWSMQSVSALLNPPYALSLTLMLVGMIFWLKKRKEGNLKWVIILGIIFGSLAGIKIYAGILIGLSLVSFWIVSSLRTKRDTVRYPAKRGNPLILKFLRLRQLADPRNDKLFNFDFFLCLFIFFVSLLLLLLMGVSFSGNNLQFKPLWFVHSMVESLDKLYLPKLAVLRINLSQQWFSWKLPFLMILELFLVLIFLVGNLGTRVLGVPVLIKKVVRKKLTDFDRLVLPILFYSFLFPLLFIQKGTVWNTIQFFYYFLFFANFYLAIFLAKIFERKRLILFILIILFTVPTTISTLKDYFGNPPPSAVPYHELEALNFLRKQKEGTVLTFPYDQFKKNLFVTPLPLFVYETTAYVSALSQKNVFLEDEMNLTITGFDWGERHRSAKRFFLTGDGNWSKDFLKEFKIDYIYLTTGQNITISPESLDLKMIFTNGETKIYQVLK